MAEGKFLIYLHSATLNLPPLIDFIGTRGAIEKLQADKRTGADRLVTLRSSGRFVRAFAACIAVAHRQFDHRIGWRVQLQRDPVQV